MMRTVYAALLLGCLVAWISAESSDDIGTFFHLTDLHFDPEYRPGADPHNSRCTKILPNATREAAVVGDYECDTPTFMLESALGFMRSIDPKPDFIVNTGDAAPHYEGLVYFEEYTEAMKVESNRLSNEIIARYFPAEQTIVVPVIGNHDVYPTEFLAPPDVPSGAQMLRDLVSTWKRFRLSDDAFSTALKGGYYSVSVDKGLRIITLNTQYCSFWNLWTDIFRNVDIAGQLEWLNATLAKSRLMGEKVYIAAHFAPGPLLLPMAVIRSTEFTDFCEKRLDVLFQEYSDILEGGFFGHEHVDGVKIFHKKVGESVIPTFTGYLTSSMGTWMWNDPAIRRFTYSRTTKKILQSELYIANLTKAMETGHLDFEFAYNMTDAYHIKNLDAASWDSLVRGALHDDAALEYLRYLMLLTSIDREPCATSLCRRELGCSMLSTTFDDYLVCMKQ